jgi:hypothetical protein
VSGDDPVSWFVIEPGWKVTAAGGEQIGHVESIIGDTGKDIFNGLAVATGLLRKARYVPAELVTEITEGNVHLSISERDADSLAPYDEPPPSEEFLAP